MPDTASVMPTRSGQRLRHTADRMPIAMPITTAHTMLATVSRNVGLKRSAISAPTGPLGARRACRSRRARCAGNEAHELLRQRLVEAEVLAHQFDGRVVASAPAASRAGSPGNRCTNMKTSTATMARVGRRPTDV